MTSYRDINKHEYHVQTSKSDEFDNGYGFLVFSAAISFLLISEIKVPSNKIKKGPVSNYYQHIFLLATVVISIIFFQWLSVLIFYAFYVLSSIIFNFAAKKSS